MYNREMINELNALSKEVFGTTSKWKKMIEKGVHTLYEEDTTKIGPDGTKETVKTPLMHVGKNGGETHQYYLNRYTAESVREFMVNVLIQRQKFRELLNKQQEELKAAENAKQVVSEHASGSSV